MTVRHAVLSLGALLVLGLGVYLLVEVRAQPAPSAVTSGASGAVPSVAAAARSGPPGPPGPSDEPARRPPPVPPPTAVRSVTAPPDPPAPAPVPSAAAQDDIPLSGPRLDAMMDEANRAYDRSEYDDAKAIASRLLSRQPGNVRMLRIMVSASCIDGDSVTAQTHYARLPASDQAQMRIRCARFGVSFPDKPGP